MDALSSKTIYRYKFNIRSSNALLNNKEVALFCKNNILAALSKLSLWIVLKREYAKMVSHTNNVNHKKERASL